MVYQTSKKLMKEGGFNLRNKFCAVAKGFTNVSEKEGGWISVGLSVYDIASEAMMGCCHANCGPIQGLHLRTLWIWTKPLTSKAQASHVFKSVQRIHTLSTMLLPAGSHWRPNPLLQSFCSSLKAYTAVVYIQWPLPLLGAMLDSSPPNPSTPLRLKT